MPGQVQHQRSSPPPRGVPMLRCGKPIMRGGRDDHQILEHVDLAKEEFEALKMLISTTFMDKNYLSL
ncbi:hypothetical protein N1851_027378 [Merluccius polli]|uniref:Uncharacterized protein n=1 Tax=Merluccius polli TaxID=89951 RepID=A0AA47NS90_MERPO|nr:hypothetical protein N1851_027378 [Merluccius polli]